MDTTKSTNFLFLPVSPFKLNQEFAENIPCVEKRTDIPLTKRKKVNGADNFTCPVGYEKLYPLLGLPKGHSGWDLTAYHNQPIYSSCEGFVEEIQTEEARGLGIGIITNTPQFCLETSVREYFKIRYWHLKSFNVKKGQKVNLGDLIGYADNTGHSSGNHLHWEVKPVKKNSEGVWYNLLQDNGFYGAVNLEPYVDRIFAPKASGIMKQLQNVIASLTQKLADLMK